MNGQTAPQKWWPALPPNIGWQLSSAQRQPETFSGRRISGWAAGYWVRLPVFGWYTSKGDCLEGKGVSPDVLVDVDPCQLNAGVDQQMNKAIEILSGVGDSDGDLRPSPAEISGIRLAQRRLGRQRLRLTPIKSLNPSRKAPGCRTTAGSHRVSRVRLNCVGAKRRCETAVAREI